MSSDPEGAAQADGGIRVSILGPVRAWRAQHEVSLGPARQQAVFAVLAAAGRPLGRDELVEAVWGTEPPATAAGSVYTYISGLRRRLGPDRLVSGPAGYQLRLHPDGLDRNRFTALCELASARSAAGDRTGVVAALDQALALWQGEAFGGLTGYRIEMERTQLAERRLIAHEQRARLLIEVGDDSVVADLIELTRAHPLREPLHEALMIALHRAGRHTEALKVYRTVRQALRAELGTEPGLALREREQTILDQLRRNGDAVTPAALRVLPPQVTRVIADGPGNRPLTGRDQERDCLRTLAAGLVRGRGGTVWIEGEPGIGKSELLLAAFADAHERGCQIAWAVAEEGDQHLPLRLMARALGREPGADGTPAFADRLFSQVQAACATGPLALVIDGLQWIDPAGALLWERLAAATGRLPLLLVGAARAQPDSAEPACLRRAVHGRGGPVISLSPLRPREVEELVVNLAGAPLGPGLAAVVPLSAGNPRTARELSLALLRRGAVRVEAGLADIPASVPIEASRPLTTMFQDMVEALPAGAQEVLRVAALLDPRFTVDDVVALSDEAPLDIVGNLDEALTAGLLAEAGTRLTFRHPVLRQILHDSVPAVARAALHRHAAEASHRAGSPVAGVSTPEPRGKRHRRCLAPSRRENPDDAAYRLQDQWLSASIRRDHNRALALVDRALSRTGDPGLVLDLYDNKVFTLQNLDRLDHAERTLHDAELFALRHRLLSGLHVTAAVQHYWRGRWDESLTEVSTATEDEPGFTFLGRREQGALRKLMYGVSALIAARRDDRVMSGAYVDSAGPPPVSDAERECGDFLLMARALVAEQQDDPDEALRVLGPLLTSEGAPLLLRHQWLPDVVRLALSVGRFDVAERAAAVCDDEANREAQPARAATAATHCRALITGDPDSALATAEHYHAIGRIPERAAVLEDASVMLAASRRWHDAAIVGDQAATLHIMLGAQWDLRRLRRRMAGYGL